MTRAPGGAAARPRRATENGGAHAFQPFLRSDRFVRAPSATAASAKVTVLVASTLTEGAPANLPPRPQRPHDPDELPCDCRRKNRVDKVPLMKMSSFQNRRFSRPRLWPLLLFAMGVSGAPGKAHAETAYLECKAASGGRMSVTINFDTRLVVVLGDYGFRWQAYAEIADHRIYWETPIKTQFRSGINKWVIDRYTGTLTSYDPGYPGHDPSLAVWRCETSEKPRRKF